MRIARLIPLLALGALVVGCREADGPVAPMSYGPRFSHIPGHSGSKITFHSDRDGDNEIFVMNADGSDVTQLTNHPANDLLPLWSPDGSRIVFGRCQATCDVVVINADGSGETVVFSDGFPGAWSPDGNRIVLGRNDGLYVINADGSGLVRVLDPDGVTDWSPDGRQLMIVSSRDGDSELYATNLDGSGVTRLTDNTASDGAGTGWSPDGTRIAFNSDRDGDEEVFVMNADGSGVTQLTDNSLIDDAGPVWSPDGTQIAFESNRAGDTQIFVINVDGSGVTQLTFGAGVNNSSPHWIGPVAPANDDFADAAGIAGVPFSDLVILTGASVEAGEPTPTCAAFNGPVSKTAWYTLTPTETGSISVRIVNTAIAPVVAAYTGNALGDLSEIHCAPFGGTATFRAEAGTTYYFQVGGLFGQGSLMEFHLEVAPQPVAQFGFNIGDPSIFDVIQFFDGSFDPAGLGIQSQQWTFGDGAGATGCCPTHRYAADGSYTVELAITTFDGRTASNSQTVLVRTHDVAITKFSAPKSASAGQTRAITVGINSKRYPETVEVQLFKSVPGGFQFVGVLTQTVPVRPSNRTTDFNFSYTFTGADAQVGKVTFKSVAIVRDARDALPADNEAIASPTKVSR